MSHTLKLVRDTNATPGWVLCTLEKLLDISEVEAYSLTMLVESSGEADISKYVDDPLSKAVEFASAGLKVVVRTTPE